MTTSIIPGWFAQKIQIPDSGLSEAAISKQVKQDEFNANAIRVVAIVILLFGIIELIHHIRKRTFKFIPPKNSKPLL